MSTSAKGQIKTSEDLAAALRIAAELEHGLCCQYLFAGYTLRRTEDDFAGAPSVSEAQRIHVMSLTQAWATQIMTIARQEMEHLAIVINLQTALGEPPHLARPNFPVPAGTYPIDAHFCLERVEATTLDRFLFYERPDYLAAELPFKDPGCCDKAFQPAEPLRLRSHAGLQFGSIQELYGEIASVYDPSSPYTLPAADLFRGSAAAQVQSSAVQWVARVNVPQVTNRAQALAAIAQIVFEGEGIGENPTSPNSHFARFAEVKRTFQALQRELSVDPALPVLCNPAAGEEAPDGANRITDPAAVRAMRLFDDGYFVMLAMLRGFFETYQGNFGTFPTFAGAAPNSALFLEGFYPFMTMFIRPLGEMICRLPAGPEHPGKNAGPGFTLSGEPLGRMDLDWYADRMASLDRDSQALHAFLAGHEAKYGAAAVQAAERQRQALHRMRLNLPRLWKEGVLNP